MRAALSGVSIFVFALAAPKAQAAPAFYISGAIVSSETNLPGAIITARNTANGNTISTVSDDEGHYRLALPAPGTYQVRVELFGFSTADRLLSITDQAQADFTLTLAPAESTAADRPPPATPSAALTEPLPRTSRGRSEAKPTEPLSADLPLDVSFVRGPMLQPAMADSATGDAPLRQSPVHFNAVYQAGNSALNASPYALHGIAVAKPEYAQNSFGTGLGGTWGKKASTSLFASYNGSRNGNPYDGFATLPTAALRAGDFSDVRVLAGPAAGQAAVVSDPATGQPFPGNRIPVDRMSPAALVLLQYIPLPNREGMSQNFRFVTATHSTSDGFGLLLTHARSTPADSSKNAPLRNNFSAQLGYRRSAANLPNIFPLLGGDSRTHGWNANAAYTLSKGFFANNLRLGFNSMSSRTLNHFRDDVAAGLAITGVSRDRFNWGLPAIDLSRFTGLRDVSPALRASRSFSFADALSSSRGKHNLKWGGEFRRMAFDLRSNTDAAGSFVFTGFATAQFAAGVPVPGTGSDFADFLLGLPQKTHVQYSNGAFSFRGDAWNLYFVDDWRVAKNLTLNLGLRYEYASPLSEAQNRLVTLDTPPDFSAVAVVRAAGVGPFTGRYPNTILAPDRSNLAPRLGVAWRTAERLIVRAGYSISYDSSLYSTLAPRLAVQPPFAVGYTGISTRGQALTFENGFPALQADTVANDFAVSRNMPVGYAQVWVLEVQNELPSGGALVASYTGTKGSHLQMLRAPNRTAIGLLLPNVGPFLWQTADGSSILHAGSVRVQKRFAQGLSFGASYMFSRSIDNDPALGDDTPVAQNDLQLSAERGLSAFDQRHRLAADYRYELPFGRGKRWLNGSAAGNQILGGWSLTGTISYASGFPFTPHLVGVFSDVASGGFGALRPDVTGQPVQLPRPTVGRFFNTSAFMAPPAGSYGNAGRNTVIGPRIFNCDAALSKSFTIGQRHYLQFQAQASNVLNTPVLAQVDTNLNSLSYGQITGVGAMRVIQLVLRYSF